VVLSGTDIDVFSATVELLTGAVVGVGAIGCGDAIDDN
jgi:hypothetical protein